MRNRTAAPIQITAEQLLGESHSHGMDEIRPPKQMITDEEELEDYK